MTSRRSFLKTIAATVFGLFGIKTVKASKPELLSAHPDLWVVNSIYYSHPPQVQADGLRKMWRISGRCGVSENGKGMRFSDWWFRKRLFVREGCRRERSEYRIDETGKVIHFEIIDVEM